MDTATQKWFNFFGGDKDIAATHEAWALGYLSALNQCVPGTADDVVAARRKDAEARLRAARAVLFLSPVTIT